jgi:hypothetical protein
MDFPGDKRAQSVLIGSILLFGFAVIALSSYQAFVIPQENEQVEFDHNQKVQSQILDLRSSLIRTGGIGTQQSTTVNLGTTYPSRTILLNPSPPTGTLRTGNDQSVIIRNASASGETGHYWDGSDRTFTTNPIQYRPGYNVYDSAPTSNIEHSIFYNRFDDGTVLTESSQPLISGRSLSFVLVDGDYSRSESGSVSVDTEPVSTSSNRVAVESSNGPVTIQFETRLNNETWTELLENQYVSNGGHIENQSFSEGTPNTLTLKLEAGVTYNLRVAKVGIGSDISQPSTAYITDVEGDGATIPEGGAQKLTAEVRDGLNNPLSGENVCAEVVDPAGGGDSVTPSEVVTNEDGQVQFTYNAPNNVQGRDTARIQVTFDCGNVGDTGATADTDQAVFEIDVYNTGGGGGNSGTGGNGGGTGSAPVVQTLDASESQDQNTRQVSVSYNVTDPNDDLSEIKLVLKGKNGNEIDREVVYNGLGTGQEDGSYTFQDTGKTGEVELIATDAQGNSASDTDPT